MGARGRQTGEPAIDPCLRRIIQSAQVGLGRALRDLDVGDDGGPVEQVVEDEQGAGHHQDCVRQVAVVRRRLGQRLDTADNVVAEIANSPAGEPGQPGDLHGRVPPHGSAQVLQGSYVGLHHGPPGLAGPARTLPAAVAEHLIGIGGEEGISRPPFTSLEGFEQKAIGTLMQLGKGGDWCVTVQHYLPGHRHHPALVGPIQEKLEARAHCGAATR